MSKPCAFTIYNASAGSGKTHTLVTEYLKILFQSKSPLAFRNILALTFTNKAVAEMKARIVKKLREFSEDDILKGSDPMFKTLCETLDMPPLLLHQRSKSILESIAHNYASFDISTIDKFNHKLIRTFAHDLKLPLNFEVELDTDHLLAKAVDRLLEKAGTDEVLTKVLVDFAIEKADDDKSWDLTYDFNTIAKLLTKENDIPYIETLQGKSLQDFRSLKIQLSQTVATLEADVFEKATETLNLLDAHGLTIDDFSGKYLPKYFQKLRDGDFNVNFGLGWQTKLEEGGNLYPGGRIDAATISAIQAIQHLLLENFTRTKQAVVQIRFLRNVLKNLTPLSVLNAINATLKEIKDENELLLISEFNALIGNEIKNQPAPYIYERIGEKFRHYFIDEFQDTSVLQWENMVPLVENALASQDLKGHSGTAMIVGDAKQAIYRWRGGKAEQFIELYTHKNPFTVGRCVRNLPANFRSLKEIVAFNNAFFKHVSELMFTNENHREIYAQSGQDITKTEGGYVELSFLDVKNLDEDESKDQRHCQKVLETVRKAQDCGFELKDICIIARKNKEGIAIAEYLSAENIPIISSQSLLLQNAPEVNFIMAIFALASQPKNDQLKMDVLNYLAEHKLQLADKHAFFSSLIPLEAASLFHRLKDYGFRFDFKAMLQSSLYDASETIIRQFGLNGQSNAYLQYFMDEVLDYTQKNTSGFGEFTAHWERKKNDLSVVAPQGDNAVQIMTIHKSKGLEFPVVIFPYANQDIYKGIAPKTWFPVDANDFHGFPHLFINLNKDLETVGAQGHNIYSNHRSELELDAINLLYVVMTRAVEHLYIISEMDLDSKQHGKANLYSGLFINYLSSIGQWGASQDTYSFGTPARHLQPKESNIALLQGEFLSVAKEVHQLGIVTNSGYLWDTAQEKALEKGNLLHHIMSQIKTADDTERVLNASRASGTINAEQMQELESLIHQIVTHRQLAPYYGRDLTVYNERDIITKDGAILRPDRIVIDHNKEATIIDYKTGAETPAHAQQLLGYQSLLETMGIKVAKKILIYINEDIQLKEF